MSRKSDADDPVELEIPNGVAEAAQSVEILRTWVADGSMVLALNPDAFGDRVADWGRILGEIAHHVAQSAKLQGYMTEAEALQAIRSGFEAAIRVNQPMMSGKIRGRVNH